jgi:hypothetical protein
MVSIACRVLNAGVPEFTVPVTNTLAAASTVSASVVSGRMIQNDIYMIHKDKLRDLIGIVSLTYLTPTPRN